MFEYLLDFLGTRLLLRRKHQREHAKHVKALAGLLVELGVLLDRAQSLLHVEAQLRGSDIDIIEHHLLRNEQDCIARHIGNAHTTLHIVLGRHRSTAACPLQADTSKMIAYGTFARISRHDSPREGQSCIHVGNYNMVLCVCRLCAYVKRQCQKQSLHVYKDMKKQAQPKIIYRLLIPFFDSFVNVTNRKNKFFD